MTTKSTALAAPIAQPIAITLGDACGIGPEIIARAWCSAPEVTQACFVAGDVGTMRRAMAVVQAGPTFPVCAAALFTRLAGGVRCPGAALGAGRCPSRKNGG